MKNIKIWIFHALGYFFLGLGVLGVVLPILPTTPFLLLSAGCFIRSSKRTHDWLLSNKYFGEYLENWYESGSISKRAKIASVIVMTPTFGSSIYVIPYMSARILLILTAFCVGAYIFTRPTAVDKNK